MPKIQDLLLYLEGFNLIDLLDLGLVIGVIYGFLYLLRGTQAVQLVRGLLIVSEMNVPSLSDVDSALRKSCLVRWSVMKRMG